MDDLNSELDKIEDWSTSLHDKVADLLKETREQNSNNISGSSVANASSNSSEAIKETSDITEPNSATKDDKSKQ